MRESEMSNEDFLKKRKSQKGADVKIAILVIVIVIAIGIGIGAAVMYYFLTPQQQVKPEQVEQVEEKPAQNNPFE